MKNGIIVDSYVRPGGLLPRLTFNQWLALGCFAAAVATTFAPRPSLGWFVLAAVAIYRS